MALFGRETEHDRARAESWARWARRQNVYAIVSLVLGVFSLIEFGALVFPGVGGIAVGIVALRQLNRTRRMDEMHEVPSRDTLLAHSTAAGIDYARGELPEPIHAIDYERPAMSMVRTDGRGLAWAGIITSVISLGFAIYLYREHFSAIAR